MLGCVVLYLSHSFASARRGWAAGGPARRPDGVPGSTVTGTEFLYQYSEPSLCPRLTQIDSDITVTPVRGRYHDMMT